MTFTKQVILITTFAMLVVGCATRPIKVSAPVPEQGSEAVKSWKNVLKLQTGTRIEVSPKVGSPVRGQLTAADHESISFIDDRSDRVETVKRDDVRKITKAGKPVSRNVLIGALIGAGIGATAAAIVVSKSNDIDSPVTIPVNAAGWGGIGALIGYLASDRDWEAVYTAASH